MCGICGVALADPRRPVDGPMLERMTSILRHRGPDSRGLYRAPGVGLGVQRLSIIDLQTGDQPIANEDGTVVVVCNGEIYNSPELRVELEAAGHRFHTKSDVEVIVHLYEDEGVECLRRLRGMFGFALWDSRRRRVMLARDRLGIKPLHYAIQPDGLYFGSELKAILATGQIARELDVQALDELFRFGFVIAPRTLFAPIRRLLPGEYLVYHDGAMSTHRYWQPRFPTRGEATSRMRAGEWAECLRAKIEETLRIHLRSDVPIGAYLSAGIDSSSVASLARRLTNFPIQTFTLSFENPEYDEVRGQRTLDQFAGHELPNERLVCGTGDFDLYPKAVWHSEDPSASGIEIPGLILSEAASRSVKVVLTGEGSDEIFGGYPWFLWDKLLRPLAALPLPLRRLMLLGPLIPAWRPRASRIFLAPRTMNLTRYQRLMGPIRPETRELLFAPGLTERLAQAEHQDGNTGLEEHVRPWSPFAQLQYHELAIRLPNFITRTLDRASMAHGVEARVPFLDHELVELCAQIPPALKMRGLQEKYILRRAMRDILPPEILGRKKRGLRAPSSQWLRDPLPPFAEDLLSAARLREKGYFVPDVVRGMLARHRRRRASREGSLLMGVLAIQLWDDLFVRAKGCFEAG